LTDISAGKKEWVVLAQKVGTKKKAKMCDIYPTVAEFNGKNDFFDDFLKPAQEGHSVRCIKD